MTSKELIKDKWYKFKPYPTVPDKVWFMKCSANGTHSASNYISNFQGKLDKDRTFHNIAGSFSNSYPYEEVTSKELKWIEEVVKRNSYFSIEEMKFDEVINDYPIY